MTRDELDQQRCEAVAARYLRGEPTPDWDIDTVPLAGGGCGLLGIEKAPHVPHRSRLRFFWREPSVPRRTSY